MSIYPIYTKYILLRVEQRFPHIVEMRIDATTFAPFSILVV